MRATAGCSHSTGDIKIRNSRYRAMTSARSIAPARATPARISRARTYITCRRIDEILGARLNTIHNLHYYLDLMRQIREGDQHATFSRNSAQPLNAHVAKARIEEFLPIVALLPHLEGRKKAIRISDPAQAMGESRGGGGAAPSAS